MYCNNNAVPKKPFVLLDSGFFFEHTTVVIIENYVLFTDALNSSAGTVIAFDEMFATILICYSSYILKEATFKVSMIHIEYNTIKTFNVR